MYVPYTLTQFKIIPVQPQQRESDHQFGNFSIPSFCVETSAEQYARTNSGSC